jgi:hypothetical protein
MNYSFNPKTDEELENSNLLQDGVYNFEVSKSTRKSSKNGNPMAELQLEILDTEGNIHQVLDYLVFCDVNLCLKKISHFCKAVGLAEEYKTGKIPEDLLGFSGKVEVTTQDEKQKEDGGTYPRKNIVKDYLKKSESEAKVPPKIDPELNDDIPF